MSTVVLRPNAIPVYGFLSFIQAERSSEGQNTKPKILDCGAGGLIPPLAIFAQQGFETFGIDISDEQLEKARKFCDEQKLNIDLRKADMRQIPFEENTFDYVFEHFSMCHLNQAETAQAVREMLRVIKPGGLCMLGVISMDTWPHSLFGLQRNPGEFVGPEHNGKEVIHSLWTDTASDQLVAAWEMVDKEKKVSYLREMAAEVSLDTWMGLHGEAPQACSVDAWREAYPQRMDYYKYVHTYYFLRKPKTTKYVNV